MPSAQTAHPPASVSNGGFLRLCREAVTRYGELAHGDLLFEASTPQIETPPAAGIRNRNLFTLQGIGKRFTGQHGPVAALQDIDLTIREGEIFGVIGRSGAGKSTLLRVLNLLERPTTGLVSFDGEDLTALPGRELRAVRRRIGMIFQHFNLLASRTVAQNVALPLELAGVPRARIAARVDELLDLVGLSAQRERYPAQISGGQKQRVGIARALANEPRVLLCDEATSALDPETTQSILELLGDINRRLGLTIVLITHQMQVIKAIADRVAVLENGRIIEAGDVADVFTAPQQALTRTLLREVIGDAIPPGVAGRVAALTGDGDAAVWRLTLRGAAVDEPLLAELSALFSLRTHLLHGYIDEVRGMPFGALVAVVRGSQSRLTEAAAFLGARGVRIEEVQL